MYQSPVREKNAHVVIVAAADDDDDDDDDDDKKTRYQSTHCHFLDGVILELHIFEIDLHSFPPKCGNPRQSWILESALWIPDSRYWIPVFVSGTWTLLPNHQWDSGFLELYSGFQTPGVRIP